MTFLVCLLAPGAAAAAIPEDPLDDAQGALRITSFDSRSVFNVGEVDSVDLRTGNLTFMVSAGGPQKFRGPMAYELKAVYNSSGWVRRPQAEVESAGGPGNPSRPLRAHYPDPAFNLGWGWGLHLGRLIEPNPYQGTVFPGACQSADPLDYEDWVTPSPRFAYIDPNGTRHELWRALHGDVNRNDVAHKNATFLYARDGSFIRVRRVSATERWVENSAGFRRVFRFTTNPEPTLPDAWRLEEIRDAYDNVIKVDYTPDSWTLYDHDPSSEAPWEPWRTTIVRFQDWTGRAAGQPKIVDKIEHPGFDESPTLRVWDFVYSLKTKERPAASSYHNHLVATCPNVSPADVLVTKPRLKRVIQPDGSQFVFQYDDLPDDVRLNQATLPSGGVITYSYSEAWDSPPDCASGGALDSSPAVFERVVSDGSGVLRRKQYLRQTERTDDIPTGICRAHVPNNFSPARPYSQQRVAVWTDLEAGTSGHSSASLHYFSIWPFTDACHPQMPNLAEFCEQGKNGGPWRLKTGRTHAERNQMINRSLESRDPLDSRRHRSSQLYACDFDIAGGPSVSFSGGPGTGELPDQVGHHVDDLLDQCTIKQEVFARYESSLAGDCTFTISDCSRESRLVSQRTVFHDDAGHWKSVDHSDYDGLGNYRKTISRSSFDSLVQTKFTNYNEGVGTLRLNPDHTIAQNITIPGSWRLSDFTDYWVEEGGARHGGEACFHSRGHRSYDRKWAATNIEPSNPAANHSNKDLVTRDKFDEHGQLQVQRFFGADTYSGMPTDANWCSNSNAFQGQRDYAIDYEYDFGALISKKVTSASFFEVLREVDRNTGWTKTDTKPSGEVLTLDYDPMGRARWVTSQLSASHRFTYSKAQGRWQIQEHIYPRGTAPGGTLPNPIREYTARYNGLGELRWERIPKYTGGNVARNVTYHPSGEIHKVDAWDRGQVGEIRRSVFGYDFRNRRTNVQFPDDSKAAVIYVGDRKKRRVGCVLSEEPVNPGDGICPQSLDRIEFVEEFDFLGRATKVTDGEGVATTMRYDPSGNRTRSTRSGSGRTQSRFWDYDGRSFITRENLPERRPIDFVSFNTRGQALTMVDRGSVGLPDRTTLSSYDELGRLTALTVDGRAVKTFTYHGSGPENGLVDLAIRHNHRTPETSGLHLGGDWRVTSSFLYDLAGRPSSRTTEVKFHDSQGGASGTTRFNQAWEYDDLGNVKKIHYPCVLEQNVDCAASSPRTVTNTYSRGSYLTSVGTAHALGGALTYHRSGLVHRIDHASGSGGSDTYLLKNGMPRVASIFLGVGTGEGLDLGDVSYDWVGNTTSIGNDTFYYDRNSRLRKAEVQGVVSEYQYDNFDNHLAGTGAVDPGTNRLLGVDYDDWGNFTAHPGANIRVAYDEIDKLEATHFDGNPTTTLDDVTQFHLYDHDDLRVMRWDGTGSELTWTLRDRGRVIREFVGISPNVIVSKDFVYAGRRLLASRDRGGVVRHYHADQIGSTRLVTSPSLARREVHYKPFGLEIQGSGERAVGFTGHENDGVTTYMRGRTYLQSSARFLQIDPGRDPSAWSQYAYGANNPGNRIDPSGEAAETIVDFVSIGISAVDLIRNPGAGTALTLGGDILGAVVPGVPSPTSVKIGAKVGGALGKAAKSLGGKIKGLFARSSGKRGGRVVTTTGSLTDHDVNARVLKEARTSRPTIVAMGGHGSPDGKFKPFDLKGSRSDIAADRSLKDGAEQARRATGTDVLVVDVNRVDGSEALRQAADQVPEGSTLIGGWCSTAACLKRE